jgi:hypothetical protein
LLEIADKFRVNSAETPIVLQRTHGHIVVEATIRSLAMTISRMLLPAIAVSFAISVSPGFAQVSNQAVSPARAKAIRECATDAQKFALHA